MRLLPPTTRPARSLAAIEALATTLTREHTAGGKVQLRRPLSTLDAMRLGALGWAVFARPVRSGEGLRWQLCYARADHDGVAAAVADAAERSCSAC
jgi:hypothetical protein